MKDKKENEIPALLTVPEMAKVLRIGKNSAYNLIRKKKLPVLRLGPKKIRIPRVKLKQWIEKNLK